MTTVHPSSIDQLDEERIINNVLWRVTYNLSRDEWSVKQEVPNGKGGYRYKYIAGCYSRQAAWAVAKDNNRN